MIIKSFILVGLQSAFGVACAFLRGVILARLLGPHEYGLALILITLTSALDLFADAGIDRFIVQSRFGFRRDVVATSHTFRVVGSTVVGLAIVLLAYPLSIAFDARELWLPISLTGGVVLLKGFANLSYKLQQRDRHFEKEVAIYVCMYSVDLVVTATLGWWFRSYWVVLVGAYAGAMTYLILTHLLSGQRYSFMPRGRIVGLVSRFSTPIYFNALLLFLASQGDRLVVATNFAKQDLAFYAAACAIGQGIVAAAGQMTNGVLLPILVPRGDPIERRRRLCSRIGAVFILASIVLAAALTLVGPFLVSALYGPAFSGLRNLIFASAIVQMIQLEQGWLTTVLMANGLTRDFPRITAMRAIAFPVAFLLVALGWSIVAIPLAFAVGAAMSLTMSYYAARNLNLIDRRLVWASFARILMALGVVALLAHR